MPKHRETRILPYTPEQMFDLVADVERYPDFLPWVVGARVRGKREAVFYADLLVGFKMIRERYTSRVKLVPFESIDVAYTKGPFKHLENHWRFFPDPQGCRVEFFLDFEFKSRLLQRVIGSLFSESVKKMVAAFETRAKTIYGTTESESQIPKGNPA